MGMMCEGCPNDGKLKECEELFNKIDCFQGFLYDRKLIYVSNGSERMAISEAIFNILKKYSTDKKK